MKAKTTKKKILNGYDKIICVGYCDLQYLLRHKDAQYYTSGQFGWDSDIYIIGGIAIVTGYRSFGNIKASHDLCKKYEDKARRIIETRDYEIEENQLESEIYNFIQEVTK